MSDTPQMIFVNLPVRDLEASKAFFAALGYAFNPTFTDQNAACMIVSDSIFVMLLTETFFAGFTSKPISDALCAPRSSPRCRPPAAPRSTRYWRKRWRPVRASRKRRATTVSCTSAASRIPMAICGRSRI
ncbi:hypothetical protein HEP74_01474 [Xanthomonas sp. SS]|nr:hypothetical protein HEP74_01474 [Xanthomonas sp. SS]